MSQNRGFLKKNDISEGGPLKKEARLRAMNVLHCEKVSFFYTNENSFFLSYLSIT